jgi:hypothetical protein
LRFFFLPENVSYCHIFSFLHTALTIDWLAIVVYGGSNSVLVFAILALASKRSWEQSAC